jgi:hypothetical protein
LSPEDTKRLREDGLSRAEGDPFDPVDGDMEDDGSDMEDDGSEPGRNAPPSRHIPFTEMLELSADGRLGVKCLNAKITRGEDGKIVIEGKGSGQLRFSAPFSLIHPYRMAKASARPAVPIRRLPGAWLNRLRSRPRATRTPGKRVTRRARRLARSTGDDPEPGPAAVAGRRRV